MGNRCGCPHHKVVPALVVLFALDFFLGSLGVVSAHFVSVSWPVLLGLAGLSKMFSSKCTCCGVPMQQR